MSSYHSARNASILRLARESSTPLPLEECTAHNGYQRYPYNGESADWKKCTNGAEKFWISEGIDMSRRAFKPAPGSSLAPESMKDDVNRYPPRIKSEALDQELPSVVGREQRPTREDNIEHIAALEPTVVFEVLPSLRYERTRQSSLSSDSAHQIIYFRMQNPGGGESTGVNGRTDNGFPLRRAYENKLDSLIDRHEPAPLNDASAKISIRLQFPNCEPYTRQIMARRSTANGPPISMEVLAHKIAEEMQKCLAKTHIANKPLIHRGRVVQLDDLYLWRLIKVSTGSWVPEFIVSLMTWV